MYVRGLCEKYDWIGSVVMIDPSVPTENLLASLVVPATCMVGRDYNIPMIEFCSRFPISRKLDDVEEMKIMSKLVEFNKGMASALAKLNEVTTFRSAAGYSHDAGFVDTVGPTMDCVLRFLDDLFERMSLEALAQLEAVTIDELWSGTDADLGQKRVEKWNAIKSKMGESYERAKHLVSQAVPTRPIDAIYKKCNHCGIVYVKPIGCDFGTSCGASIGGQDVLPWTYEYVRGRGFSIVQNQKMGAFEAAAFKLRRAFSVMVTKRPDKYYGGADAGAVVQQHTFDKPCGKPISWETMIPLSLEELQRHKLIPDGVIYEVTHSQSSVQKKDMSMAMKLKEVSKALEVDTTLSMALQISSAYEQVGAEEDKSLPLPKRVAELYRIVIGTDEIVDGWTVVGTDEIGDD
mmetsp:Transcript_324/g.1123  ORF Transcript_324/g.1123 Transcript_324/m.1123 type:complete len:404 (+) Transcript_324:694-1905(+)